MLNQTRHKQCAAAGVALAVVGFLTAHLATRFAAHTTLALLGALALFAVGLVLVETALFRALDEIHEEEAIKTSWAPPIPA